MATITASQVAELRKATDCGLMECKKALQEAEGNIEKAIQILREKGVAKAAKKADRLTAEGVISIVVNDSRKIAVMLEVNSETDFVARESAFQNFVHQVATVALEHQIDHISALPELEMTNGKIVEQCRQELVAKIGENIHLRRIALMKTNGLIGLYLHGTRIGVLVAIGGGDDILAKDLAMHIAASKPLVIFPEQVPSDLIEREKEIYIKQALESGKPQNVIEKMVEGKLNKYLNEVSLIKQAYVKDPEIQIAELLKRKNAQVEAFIRFELGEGIEKRVVSFAEEVAAQMKKD